MSSKFCFTFSGSREMFLERINRYLTSSKESLRFHDYIIEVSENSYRFGLKHGGHSGGYWYEPMISEENGNLIICGRIEYLSYFYDNTRIKRLLKKIDEWVFIILLFPIILIVKTCQLIGRFAHRKEKPVLETETEVDRLYYLMEDILGCTRM